MSFSKKSKKLPDKHPDICIIGAGLSGLCAGIQLKEQLKIQNFTIFEEKKDIGGVWLNSNYPGCGCDVPSHVYSYSFAPNPNWSKMFARKEEIWEYIQSTAVKYDLYKNLKPSHRVTSQTWDENLFKWHVTVLNIPENTTSTYLFDVVIFAIGGLRVPNIPPEFVNFKGPIVHSSEWDDSVNIDNKVVAIVGSGASGVQIIPRIVDRVKRLVVYQRHPAWVLPKTQMNHSKLFKLICNKVPIFQKVCRSSIFNLYDLNHKIFEEGSFPRKFWTNVSKFQLLRQVKNAELREKLTPTDQFGCRRITLSNIYYPALCKSNVTVARSPITSVTQNAIVSQDGTKEEPEVLILATGFKIQELFAPMQIIGSGGVNVLDVMLSQGARSYLGITNHHMPNFFCVLGPNSLAPHNSVLTQVESQVNWIIKMIREMMVRNARKVVTKRMAEDEYEEFIQKSLENKVWNQHKCASWYANDQGKITVIWPKSLNSYKKITKTVAFSHFDIV